MAFPQLTAKLAEMNNLVKQKPDDLKTRLERGRLLLDKGDCAGAILDLKKVAADSRERDETSRAKTLLFTALTQLLRNDFAAGEKYLDDYRALCRVEVPSGVAAATRQKLQAEERRRLAGYFALLARPSEARAVGRCATGLPRLLRCFPRRRPDRVARGSGRAGAARPVGALPGGGTAGSRHAGAT